MDHQGVREPLSGKVDAVSDAWRQRDAHAVGRPLGSEPSRPSGRGREPLRRVFSKQIPELLFGIRRCLWSLGALPVATGELGMLLDVGRRPDVV